MSILVITEKPSVARMVAQALSCHEKCGGYIKGEGYIISWCFGHLIRKAAPEAYDMMYKKWDISMLPIIPERWIHEVIPQTKEQFKTLKTLMADQAVEQVCCCTDCGREGQLIFQLVYDMAGCRKPVSRFWASSLEEEAIRKAFSSLRDGNEFIPLYQAAECRAEADWLIGMNLTRLYSLKYGNGRVLNIGRVKSPTLSLLAERETQISVFVKEPYYVTHLIMGDIDAVSPRISDKRKAEQMAENLKNSQAFITAVSKEKKKTMPPRLYDLTSLQRDANRIYGMTAKETLDAVQELYEEQLCTYPRTDSKFLTDDMADTAALVYMAIQKCSLAVIADIRLDTAPNIDILLNSKKVTDHHAIIPTVRIGDPIRISKLNNQNEKILRLIIQTD